MLEGLPPNDAAQVLRFSCDERQARAAADAVGEAFDPAQTAAAAFEDAGSAAEPKPWTVEIYFGSSVDPETVRARIGEVTGPDLAQAAVLVAIPEQDWVQASLHGLAPVRAGRFLVHGRHDRARVKANDMALEIEAALAFGTGHHGTTRGCLYAIESVLKRRTIRRALDLGTGTGVLAMAIAKATKRAVQCGDIDPVAVTAAAGNAALNGLGGLVRPVVARGFGHPDLRAAAPYDMIVANILAAPLRRLAPAIGRNARAGAELILSGLQPRDVAGVISAYRAQGFSLRRRRELEGWVTLEFGFKSPGAHARGPRPSS